MYITLHLEPLSKYLHSELIHMNCPKICGVCNFLEVSVCVNFLYVFLSRVSNPILW